MNLENIAYGIQVLKDYGVTPDQLDQFTQDYYELLGPSVNTISNILAGFYLDPQCIAYPKSIPQAVVADFLDSVATGNFKSLTAGQEGRDFKHLEFSKNSRSVEVLENLGISMAAHLGFPESVGIFTERENPPNGVIVKLHPVEIPGFGETEVVSGISQDTTVSKDSTERGKLEISPSVGSLDTPKTTNKNYEENHMKNQPKICFTPEELTGVLALAACKDPDFHNGEICEKHGGIDPYDDDYYEDLCESEELIAKAFEYLKSLNIHPDRLQDLMDLFQDKFPEHEFSYTVLKLRDIRPFAAGGNIFEDSDGIDDATLFVMRWLAGLKMEEVLGILKFDLTDSNLVQDLETGNIGTAQRWAKTITGGSLEADDEIMCGRYTTKPRLATFPNEGQSAAGIPITKYVDIASVCSHHFLPYGTLLKEGSYAVISYIPKDYVLGISKLQRLADWVSRRPTIQEDLAKNLWEEISKAAQTEDVYVGIFDARHTCEYLRGSQSFDGGFTTEFYKGRFLDADLRNQVAKRK